jgi:hypothetical protein
MAFSPLSHGKALDDNEIRAFQPLRSLELFIIEQDVLVRQPNDKMDILIRYLFIPNIMDHTAERGYPVPVHIRKRSSIQWSFQNKYALWPPKCKFRSRY